MSCYSVYSESNISQCHISDNCHSDGAKRLVNLGCANKISCPSWTTEQDFPALESGQMTAESGTLDAEIDIGSEKLPVWTKIAYGSGDLGTAITAALPRLLPALFPDRRRPSQPRRRRYDSAHQSPLGCHQRSRCRLAQ